MVWTGAKNITDKGISEFILLTSLKLKGDLDTLTIMFYWLVSCNSDKGEVNS